MSLSCPSAASLNIRLLQNGDTSSRHVLESPTPRSLSAAVSEAPPAEPANIRLLQHRDASPRNFAPSPRHSPPGVVAAHRQSTPLLQPASASPLRTQVAFQHHKPSLPYGDLSSCKAGDVTASQSSASIIQERRNTSPINQRSASPRHSTIQLKLQHRSTSPLGPAALPLGLSTHTVSSSCLAPSAKPMPAATQGGATSKTVCRDVSPAAGIRSASPGAAATPRVASIPQIPHLPKTSVPQVGMFWKPVVGAVSGLGPRVAHSTLPVPVPRGTAHFGAKAEQQDTMGYAPVRIPAHHGQKPVATALMEPRADVNKRAVHGTPPDDGTPHVASILIPFSNTSE